MNPANDFAAWLHKAQAQTELVLERLLPAADTEPQRLHHAMRYVSLGGGKRLRPLLVLAAAETGRPHGDALEAAMAAVELIHVYSLVHDDLPAMDNDSLRRGKPTCHIQYDEATACSPATPCKRWPSICSAAPTACRPSAVYSKSKPWHKPPAAWAWPAGRPSTCSTSAKTWIKRNWKPCTA